MLNNQKTCSGLPLLEPLPYMPEMTPEQRSQLMLLVAFELKTDCGIFQRGLIQITCKKFKVSRIEVLMH